MGADFLSDDFVVAIRFVELGVVDGALDLSFSAPARPLVGPYYVLSYQVLGDRPLLHALVMAALNGALVVAVWRALRNVVGEATAGLAALLFAVVPNRAATRLWFVLGPNLLAVICVAVATALLLRRGRWVVASGLFVVGVLAYEGVAGLAVTVIAWWWFQDRAGRTRQAAAALAPVLVAVAVAWVVSPKRGGPPPFARAGTAWPGQLGSGFWGGDVLGTLGLLMSLCVLTWCLATTVLPSFRRPDSRLRREVATGGLALVVGAVPFMVGGAPFAVRGIFDRNNLVPDLGSCLVVGALLGAVLRWSGRTGAVASAVVTAVLGFGNVQDVRDYRDAAVEGQALIDAVLADVDPRAGTVVVTPPLPGGKGVAQFILDSDLTSALTLRQGPEWATVSMPNPTPRCADLLAGADSNAVFLYHRVQRTVTRLPDPTACPDG